MKITKISMKELNPAVYNPRKDLQEGDLEYEKIKRSIEEFGYVDPIIFNLRQDGSRVIVGGHQRFKILQEMGYEKIDAVEVELDEIKEKALNIALNKIKGKWDKLKLKDVLEEMDTGELDVNLSGFDLSEIEELMTEFYDDDFDPVSDLEQGKLDEIEKQIYRCPRCENEFEG